MINFIKRKIREYRCRKMIKRYFEPDNDFLNSCRETFIIKMCREINGSGNVRFYLSWIWLKYSLAIFLCLLILGSSAVVYADKTNVDYNSPFYSFKRLAEDVRIIIAAEEQLPILHTELAQRRLDEIKRIKADAGMTISDTSTTTQDSGTSADSAITTKETATTTKKAATDKKILERIKAEEKKNQETMANLRNEMRQEVSSVMDDIENKSVQGSKIENLCNSVLRIMKEDEQTDGDETAESHAGRWSRFQKNCGEYIRAEFNNNQESDNSQKGNAGS